jgi:hypothetical protein
MNYNFYLFFNFFVPKTYVLETLHGSLFVKTLWAFLLGFSNLKMTLVTLNKIFHIDLGRFVIDLTCINQRLK